MRLTVLFIILYVLLFLLRLQQDPFEPKIDVFKDQRDFLDKQVQEHLPSPEAELTSGILLGQNHNLPPQFKLALRDTSTLHIVVASGQNLSMVGGFFLALAGLVKRRTAIVLSLIAVLVYTLLTGFQVPIIRAAIMFVFASAAQWFGRDRSGSRILVITALLMLLVNPKWISDLSFQLSFLATMGVLVVAPILKQKFSSLPGILREDLAVSLGAQAMVMPVIASNFHQISLVSLIANVLVLWAVPFIMILGSLILFLGSLITWPLLALTKYFVYVVTFFGHLPFAWQYVGEVNPIVWLGYYLVIAAIMLSLNMYVQTENSRRT